MKRRGFLQAAGGSAIAAVGFLYPGVADAARRGIRSPTASVVPDPGGPDPTYAGGEVVSIDAGGVVLHTPSTARAVRLPNDTKVWKEFDVTPAEIDLGDWVDVKGQPQVDGSLLATSGMVFVNIGRRDGTVENVSSQVMTVRNEHGSHDLELSRVLEVVHGGDGSLLPRGLADIAVGSEIGAVGLRLPRGGFRATRIWTS